MSSHISLPKELLLAVAAILAAACSSGGTPTNGNQATGIAGTWTGTAGDITMSVTLTETYGTVSGSGQLSNVPPSGGISPETVGGTYAAPNVSLTMTGPIYSVLTVSGTLTDDHIVGTVGGLGPGVDSVKLNRVTQ